MKKNSSGIQFFFCIAIQVLFLQSCTTPEEPIPSTFEIEVLEEMNVTGEDPSVKAFVMLDDDQGRRVEFREVKNGDLVQMETTLGKKYNLTVFQISSYSGRSNHIINTYLGLASDMKIKLGSVKHIRNQNTDYSTNVQVTVDFEDELGMAYFSGNDGLVNTTPNGVSHLITLNGSVGNESRKDSLMVIGMDMSGNAGYKMLPPPVGDWEGIISWRDFIPLEHYIDLNTEGFDYAERLTFDSELVGDKLRTKHQVTSSPMEEIKARNPALPYRIFYRGAAKMTHTWIRLGFNDRVKGTIFYSHIGSKPSVFPEWPKNHQVVLTEKNMFNSTIANIPWGNYWTMYWGYSTPINFPNWTKINWNFHGSNEILTYKVTVPEKILEYIPQLYKPEDFSGGGVLLHRSNKSYQELMDLELGASGYKLPFELIQYYPE